MEGGERKFSLPSQTEPLHNTHFNFSTPTQQHQSHEMLALKKAYADVILNTVKEAAGRVMVSERRAAMFQQEVAAAKEEALQMLMRLKQMMDAKKAEAEKASLEQQRKIEVLEAQLNEAEDVITDLRAELKHVYLELEKTRDNQVQPLNEQNVKQVASFQESAKPETSVSSPHKELESVTSCDVANKSLPMNVLDNNSCNSKQQTEQLCISNLEDCNGHDSDFASIITRSKEPELRRNGFTQRIRALDGNLLDEKLLMQDVHSQHCGKKLVVIAKDSNEQVAKFSALTKKMAIKKHIKRLKIPKRKIFSYYRSCFLSSCRIHVNGVCSLPSIKSSAINKWKRKKRKHRHVVMKSSVFRRRKPSFALKQWSSVCDNGKCCEDEYGAKMKRVPPLTDVEPVHGSCGVTESVKAVDKFELVEKAIEKDNKLEGSAAQNLTAPSSEVKVKVSDIPSTNTIFEDAKSFEENDGSSSQVDDNRLLKYTFQRKRKKESFGNADQNTDSEKRNADQNTDSEKRRVNRRMEDKQKGSLEPQKSNVMEETSTDNRHLAPVAHQLIS